MQIISLNENNIHKTIGPVHYLVGTNEVASKLPEINFGFVFEYRLTSTLQFWINSIQISEPE